MPPPAEADHPSAHLSETIAISKVPVHTGWGENHVEHISASMIQNWHCNGQLARPDNPIGTSMGAPCAWDDKKATQPEDEPRHLLEAGLAESLEASSSCIWDWVNV